MARHRQTLLRYITEGEGEPVLFLHGFAANLYTWRHLAPPLAAEQRVILADLKGFGQSPKPRDGRYSIRHQASLVGTLARELALQQLTLVGHSYGGAVALMLALRWCRHDPGRLRRLVLVSSAAYPQPLPPYMALAARPVLGPILLRLVSKEFLIRRALQYAFHRSQRIERDAVRAYARPLQHAEARYALIQAVRQLVPPNVNALVARYPSIDVPTLILWGRHDRVIPLAVGQRLHREMPRSSLCVLDDCGHVPQEEKPAETLQAIRRFLRETGHAAQPTTGEAGAPS